MCVDRFYFVILGYALFRAIRGIYRLLASTRWLKINSLRLPNSRPGKIKYNFIILLPVLREQEIIAKTFQIFSNLKGEYKLIFITTQKEDFQKKLLLQKLRELIPELLKIGDENQFAERTSGIFPKTLAEQLFKKLGEFGNDQEATSFLINSYKLLPHTREILERLIQESGKSNKISILDYPRVDGVMSHQLNFACNFVNQSNDPQKTFIMVYNADSVVSEDLIILVEKFLGLYPKAKVIQQSAVFLNNFNNFKGHWRKSFLQAVALLQTRWTLSHEIPRILTQFNSKIGNFIEGSHVVGHGLFIRSDILNEVGNFPTKYLNEDLPLGYLIRLHGEKIYPFPILEYADSPTIIKSMFNQYKVWFYGVFNYPQYMYDAIVKLKLPILKALIWGLKYCVRALMWLLLSFTWFFLFIYPLLSGNFTYLLFTLFAFVIYAPLSYYLIIKIYRKSAEADWKVYLMSFPVYLTHSLGPLMAVKDFTLKFFFKKTFEKTKTER